MFIAAASIFYLGNVIVNTLAWYLSLFCVGKNLNEPIGVIGIARSFHLRNDVPGLKGRLENFRPVRLTSG